MKEIITNIASDDDDRELGSNKQLSDDGNYSPTSVHGSSEPNGIDDADELMTSDCGDPPLGIIDDGSSSDFWRSAPQSVVNGKEQRTGIDGNNTNHTAHDGEKPSLTVGKRSGGLKSATSAATTTAPRPQAVPRPAPKKPVVSPSHIDFNVS